MQINAEQLKHERNKRAWSQEHLAQVAGLGVRTIQRIEATGTASRESVAAIATAFEMTAADFVRGPKPASGFDAVRKAAANLPDVTDATTRLGGALKFNGNLLACEAIHLSAEPDSIMVTIGKKRRAELLAQKSDTYYLSNHYALYPAILVRLKRIKHAELKDLLRESLAYMRKEMR